MIFAPRSLDAKVTDINCGGHDHIPARTGFISAVRAVLKMRPMALATIGVPCSSFVWINSATSQRSETSPFGNEQLPHVALGNMWLGRNRDWVPVIANTSACCIKVSMHNLRIAARVCLILLLLTARKVFFMIEQPFSSKWELLPYARHVFDVVGEVVPVHNVFLWGTYCDVALADLLKDTRPGQSCSAKLDGELRPLQLQRIPSLQQSVHASSFATAASGL